MKKIFAFAFIVLALSAVSCKKDKKGGSVKPVVVAGVTLDKTTLALMEGETYQLEATVTPDNAVNKNVIWSVDDDNVVSVTDGLVMGLLEGTATITVTTEDGGKTAACVVTVEAEIIPPSAVNILQDEYELEVGDEFDMATHLTVDGPGGVDMSVEWTSTDSEVAVVENNKILRDGIQPLDEDFFSQLLPVDIDTIQDCNEIYIQDVLNIYPEAKFFKCRYLVDQNLCTKLEKPQICEDFPSKPFAFIHDECGYCGDQFLKIEMQKQKIRKIKEEIVH